MSEKLLIDCDYISFKVAAACEKKYVDVTYVPKQRVKRFKTRTEFKKWLKENPTWKLEDFSITDVQEAEPLNFAFNTINRMVQNIKDATGIQDAAYFISGDNNFRLSLPLPTQYKSNREDAIKPLLLKECRQYMIDHFKAVIIDGEEVDDKIARLAYQAHRRGDKWVQCAVDKDAAQVCGWLYNPDKDTSPHLIDSFGTLYREEELVNNAKGEPVIKYGKVRGTGFIWLCFQWLYGDPTDCYRPADLKAGYKFGEVGAFDLLKHCTTKKECLDVVNAWYKATYPEPVTYTAWNGIEYTKDWTEIRDMYRACAYMQVEDVSRDVT